MRRRRRGRGDPRPAPAPSHLAAARRRGRRGGRARRGGGHSVRHGPVHHGGPPAPRGVMRRPTRWLGLALAAATLPPWGGGRAAAQTGPQTNLVLTVAAGVVNGGSLWTIPRQPFCPAFNGSCTAGYDTLRLARDIDRKSTRLNSSHVAISYAVFCLKKKKKKKRTNKTTTNNTAACLTRVR